MLSVALEGRSRSTLHALRLLFPPPSEGEGQGGGALTRQRGREM